MKYRAGRQQATDLACVAVVMIFLPLAGDQSRPAASAGDDGQLTPGTPGSHVSAM